MVNERFGLTEAQRGALGKALTWTQEYFDKVSKDVHIGGHGFDKTMRQMGAAKIIASVEGYPVFLPVLTAMVMDVGRVTDDPRSKSFQHGELSRKMIENSLFSSLDILTPKDRILVGKAVEDHSKLNENVWRSYVVEVAMDADRLDCLGALGPLRSASWRPNIPIILPEETGSASGDTEIQTMWQDMSVRHMEWFDMLWTATARKIAAPRVKKYRRYLETLKSEVAVFYEAFESLGI